jgi:hypothetical protein
VASGCGLSGRVLSERRQGPRKGGKAGDEGGAGQLAPLVMLACA